MKECFGVVGSLISGSEFEDIIHQSGLCSSGSLNGVISASHYNRCWNVHSHLAEALERLLFERFCRKPIRFGKLLLQTWILEKAERISQGGGALPQ